MSWDYVRITLPWPWSLWVLWVFVETMFSSLAAHENHHGSLIKDWCIDNDHWEVIDLWLCKSGLAPRRDDAGDQEFPQPCAGDRLATMTQGASRVPCLSFQTLGEFAQKYYLCVSVSMWNLPLLMSQIMTALTLKQISCM